MAPDREPRPTSANTARTGRGSCISFAVLRRSRTPGEPRTLKTAVQPVQSGAVRVGAAPLNEQTCGTVDAAFLAALPDGALVVNAGRGKIVDTDALVAELQTGRLRAALDVTDPEPLPEDHPLWDCPGTIISSHMARTVPGTNALCYAVAAEQIRALVEGNRPTNYAVVDRSRSRR